MSYNVQFLTSMYNMQNQNHIVYIHTSVVCMYMYSCYMYIHTMSMTYGTLFDWYVIEYFILNAANNGQMTASSVHLQCHT